MPVVPVGRELLAVSRRINIDPLAVREPARRFVGVELSRAEVRLLLEHLDHGQREAAARLVGLRRGRSQRHKT